jgi:NADP-dependent 3-hydroxy acid dehydrogenase YdfG
MANTIAICGFGPGISTAVAERFGAAGFSVALLARNGERLAAGVKALASKNIKAQAFTADLGDPAAIRGAFDQVRKAFGAITVIEWTAYNGSAGDLLTASAADLTNVLQPAIVGLTTAIQAALPDLREHKGAVLVTNGGLGFFDAAMDGAAVDFNSMGLAIANAAKHKACRMLARKLAPQGVFLGEVVVTGLVKGTAFDRGNATIDPAKVAAKFWELYETRTANTATV